MRGAHILPSQHHLSFGMISLFGCGYVPLCLNSGRFTLLATVNAKIKPHTRRISTFPIHCVGDTMIYLTDRMFRVVKFYSPFVVYFPIGTSCARGSYLCDGFRDYRQTFPITGASEVIFSSISTGAIICDRPAYKVTPVYLVTRPYILSLRGPGFARPFFTD